MVDQARLDQPRHLLGPHPKRIHKPLQSHSTLVLAQLLEIPVVFSSEVGCDKPDPDIFLAALKKAQVKPEEAVYVGDQYDLDVVGARGVGMKAVLIDRNDFFTHITDCPRIRSLTEIVKHV